MAKIVITDAGLCNIRTARYGGHRKMAKILVNCDQNEEDTYNRNRKNKERTK